MPLVHAAYKSMPSMPSIRFTCCPSTFGAPDLLAWVMILPVKSSSKQEMRRAEPRSPGASSSCQRPHAEALIRFLVMVGFSGRRAWHNV